MSGQYGGNVFLTGMMGSGKTTVGKTLAAWTGFAFVDLDDAIEQKAGKSIAKIFADEGEAAFRDLETDVLRETSQHENQIIATGGGVVLREENVAIMRQSGLIALIDRPLAAILGDIDPSKRPLLVGGVDRVKEIYLQRIELYRARCDLRVENNTTADDAAALLQRALFPGIH